MTDKPNIRGMWDRIEEQANDIWPTDKSELIKSTSQQMLEETLEKIQERFRAIEAGRLMAERLRSEAVMFDNRKYNLEGTIKLMKDWLVKSIPITKQGNYIIGPWTVIAKLQLDIHIYNATLVPMQYWEGQNPSRRELYKAILSEGKTVPGAQKQESYELTILPTMDFEGKVGDNVKKIRKQLNVPI